MGASVTGGAGVGKAVTVDGEGGRNGLGLLPWTDRLGCGDEWWAMM